MNETRLPRAPHGVMAQIWIASPTKSGLDSTSPPIEGVSAIFCHEDGELSVEFYNGPTETWDHLVAGDQVGLHPRADVTIVSGIWSFM